MSDILSAPISSFRGVGPKRAALLLNLGVSTVEDLIWLFPRRYEDRRNVSKICGLVPGRNSVVSASVEGVERRRTQKSALELVVCELSDGTGNIKATWFNRKGLEYILKEGTSVVLYGIPSLRSGVIEFSNPEFEVINGADEIGRFMGIVPVYPSTAGLPHRWFRRFTEDLLEEALPFVAEILPEQVIKKRALVSRAEAIRGMHRPVSEEDWKESRRRLAYEELFIMQAGMAVRRDNMKRSRPVASVSPGGAVYKKFRSSLPFELTNAQEQALEEVFADTVKGSPMSRLLQGDVGSGKTLVAVGLAAAGADAGVQTAIMAPTEVLAEQLYSQAVKWLSQAGVKCILLKGGQGASTRREALDSIRDGSSLVVVGTQALLEENVEFKKLGVVIIDEQHRFGVMQRAVMMKRGAVPHLLMMSATPIPRTLTLSLFGDLDVSALKEKPEGRHKVETRMIDVKKIGALMQFLVDEARAGGRIYWICPRVDDGGAPDIASVEKRYSFIAKHMGILGVGFLHGRMDGTAKDEVLGDFRSGKIKILVSTTVVEVGVDVPEASVIVIESPERFGLSQLHQLRGRVGRGVRRGVCILLVSNLEGDIPERLGVMLNTEDGFEIAEADLCFRGPGEISGAAQHGITEFKIADLGKDIKLLLEAKEDADEWIRRDRHMSESPAFAKKLKSGLGKALGTA